MGTMRFLMILLLFNTKACIANRTSFLFQMIFMIFNNLIFAVTWWIFFQKYQDIRGWHLSDLLTLNGVVAGAFGLQEVVFGGGANLARTIADGELDSFLVLPKRVLVHVMASVSNPSGWGDLVSSIVFFSLSGFGAVRDLPKLIGLVLASFLVMTASTAILHSAAFWFGQINSLARLGREFLIMFSVYPQSVYGGALKLLLFTLIPAGFVGYLPVEILRDFSWQLYFFLWAGALGYCALAVAVFRLGLRRYESGSRFAVR